MTELPITEDWLRSVGFRWHEVERSPKHLVLWLGDVVRDGGFTSTEDLGVELSVEHKTWEGSPKWFCWLRGDYSHRYSRFIHVRQLRYQHELVRLIEGLTGIDWKPENIFYGKYVTDKQADYFRKERERLDIRYIEGSHPWNDLEKDESRGYPLQEHQELLKDKSNK